MAGTAAVIPAVGPLRPAAASEEASAADHSDQPSPVARFNRIRERWLAMRGFQLSIQVGGLILIAGLLIALPLAYLFGKSRGRSEAARLSASRVVKVPAFPADSLADLDAALLLLRNGSSIDALSALDALLKKLPGAPSLHYATAIAALQAGYPREAGRLADASVGLGHRVADALALKASCAVSSSGDSLRDKEALLRAAIAADPMNPNPFLELATLLRVNGRVDEAMAALKSAGLRMMPADSRTVLDTTLAIMSGAEAAGDGVREATGIPVRDFPAALAELQAGQFEQAAAILRGCQQQVSPDLFAYLINDPEFRRYASRPELRGLF